MNKQPRKSFTLIRRRLTSIGVWDDGKYRVSSDTVSMPLETLQRATIVSYPSGMKGISDPCSRIDVDGEKYLVLGEISL